MTQSPRHSLIKLLQSELPRGMPFDLETLHRLDVSSQLAAHYARSGWLIRIAQGVYAFQGDEISAMGAIRFLQSRVTGLHVASKTALAWQGVRHDLESRAPLELWGDIRFVLPDWFTSRFPARYTSAKLFDWTDTSLTAKSITTPLGTAEGLHVSIPERAILELLYEAGIHHGLEESRNIFDGLRNLRHDMVGRLLMCTTSVKTVRLFLTWARETAVVDVEALLHEYSIPVGSDRRWMSRLKDGTLLSLNPYG